jgi:signal transduction histidine kinase
MPIIRAAPDALSPDRPASRSFLYELAAMIVFNFLITLLLVLLGDSKGFAQTLKLCNAIGFSIWGAFELLRFIVGERLPMPVMGMIAVPAGFIVGSKIAALLGAIDLISVAMHDPSHELKGLAGGLMVAMFATGFFIFYWRSETYRADLQSERRRAAEALQSETQARLALLQAQIEPHFLFNTLANAQSVIESDPQMAKSILDHLNQYLRVSLGRTRRSTSSLGDEVSLISELLAIAELRLGSRLRYVIDVPAELRAARLPPLLVQPLVENALRHGIEPAVSGGEVRIEARREGDSLRLRVTDTGVGLNAGSPERIGLGNVRGRLASLYGEGGRLALYGCEPHGVVAEITLPLEGV